MTASRIPQPPTDPRPHWWDELADATQPLRRGPHRDSRHDRNRGPRVWVIGTAMTIVIASVVLSSSSLTSLMGN